MANLLNLPFMKKAGQPEASSPAPPAVPEVSDEELRHRLYKLIIDRYRDRIEEYEQKSVTDLKGLIVPHNESITEIKESITADFHPYVYEQHFTGASAMAFSYVSAFRTLSSPVSFWLSFSDMQELMAGDEIDKSILLCSILRCLGCESAKVFVTDSKNSYVLFQYSGKSYVADHSKKGLAAFEGGQEALSSLSGKILYSFNDHEYEDFQEGG